MSIRAMTWAWTAALSPTPKLVLMALADIADDQGLCWPSVKALARKCSLSERSVQRVLRSLESEDFLSVEAQFRKDGSRSSNRYRLALDALPPQSALIRGRARPAGVSGLALRIAQEPADLVANLRYRRRGEHFFPERTNEPPVGFLPWRTHSFTHCRTAILARRAAVVSRANCDHSASALPAAKQPAEQRAWPGPRFRRPESPCLESAFVSARWGTLLSLDIGTRTCGLTVSAGET